MGGGGGFLGLGGGGGGGSSKPDNSAYERQLAEQREATAKAEAEAERMKKAQDEAYKRQTEGRRYTILSGGDEDTSAVKRKTLLGA